MSTRRLLLIPLLLLLPCTTYTLNTEFLKKIFIGIPTILLVHIGSEYVTTGIHELGHAVTNRAYNGDPIRIGIMSNKSNNVIQQLCIPWIGYAVDTYTLKSRSHDNAIITAAGPIAGILATKIQLHMLEYVLGKIHKRTPKEISKRSCLQPFTFFADLAHGNKALIHPSSQQHQPLSLSEFVIYGIMFFRVARIIGETLYGFFPIHVPRTEGDGILLWENITGSERSFNLPLVPLTLLPFAGAISYGLLSGAYERWIKKQSPSTSTTQLVGLSH